MTRSVILRREAEPVLSLPKEKIQPQYYKKSPAFAGPFSYSFPNVIFRRKIHTFYTSACI